MKFPIRRLSTRFAQFVWGGLALISLFVFFFFQFQDVPQEQANPGILTGMVEVIDGDSVHLAGYSLRLQGIDAPELGQVCHAPDGSFWNCGARAKEFLTRLANEASWTCLIEGQDKYKRLLASCELGEADDSTVNPARELVLAGLAHSYGGFEAEEALAKASGQGVFFGEYILPQSWRRGERFSQNPNILAQIWSDFSSWVSSLF